MLAEGHVGKELHRRLSHVGEQKRGWASQVGLSRMRTLAWGIPGKALLFACVSRREFLAVYGKALRMISRKTPVVVPGAAGARGRREASLPALVCVWHLRRGGLEPSGLVCPDCLLALHSLGCSLSGVLNVGGGMLPGAAGGPGCPLSLLCIRWQKPRGIAVKGRPSLLQLRSKGCAVVTHSRL